MSLGVRLMLLNGLVLILVLSGFAGVTYVTQQQSMQRSLDASLQEQARLLRNNMAAAPDRGRWRAGAELLPGPPTFVAPDVFIQIAQVTAGGAELIARSRNLGDQSLPVNLDLLEPAVTGQEVLLTVDVEGQPYRMYVAPIRRAGPNDSGAARVIQVARPLSGIQSSLSILLTTFTMLGALGVLASLAAGWLLARAALRPIDRLAAAAHAIGAARDFRRRVPLLPTTRRDEIGRLTEELNHMLSQLQAAYEQLETANQQLGQALSSQRRFVADASHELRTPLTSLRGNLELLQRALDLGEPLDDEQELLVAEMTAETERLSRLVVDLLLLAQADAGQHLALVATEVGPVVRDAFRSARFLHHDVTLELGNVADGLRVAADADRLKQLCLILLDNALKYTPTGGRVVFSAGPLSRAGVDGAGIVVSDTGSGISAEDRPWIFERFYRSAPARDSQGAGLGLAIARWIVDEHHGTIEAESNPGAGSTFTVWLPELATQNPHAAMPNAGQSTDRAPAPAAV